MGKKSICALAALLESMFNPKVFFLNTFEYNVVLRSLKSKSLAPGSCKINVLSLSAMVRDLPSIH